MRAPAPPAPTPDECDAIGANPFSTAGCRLADAAGQLGGDVVAGGVASAFDNLALSVGKAAAEMFANAMTWWINQATVIDPNSAAVQGLQDYTRPLVALILMISVLAQAIRMILSRKKDPAVEVGLGLVRFAVITGLGLVVLAAALTAADELARTIMEPAVDKFAERMAGVFEFLGTTQPFMLFFLGLVIFGLSLLQWLLAFFRQAGILVLAVMIPLAASGSVSRATRPWMSKLAGWLIALVAYKPMAAMIYAIGLELMGEADLATAVIGMMVLTLAVLALPAMLKFFQWAPLSPGGGGGAGGVLAAGALGAVALSQLGGGSANRQADAMGRSGPQTAPAGAAASPGPSALPSGGPAAPAAAAGGAGGGAAAAAGPPGVAVAGAIAVGNAAKQAPGAAVNKMTGEG